jgi:hypothetical protein
MQAMRAQAKNYLKTGQVSCYDPSGGVMECAGSGQDAEFGGGVVWHPETRFDLKAGTVFDSATGLYWLRDAGYGEFPKTWQEAHEFIAWMNRREVEGHSDWRLPNRRELRSLISHQLPSLYGQCA